MFHEIDAQLLILARIAKPAQAPSMILAPLGVGSLTQAIISHYKSPSNTASAPAVVTVEPDTAATLYKSLKSGQSLSINTSPTIMAGLECGTVSSIAWSLLKDGVDISTTISDWECHEAILYLAKHGIGAGPCGAAALAGLRRIASDPASREVLTKESVIVCICTEGTRPYKLPTPVASPELPLTSALIMLHISAGSSSNIVFAMMNFAAQWLEYRDIDVQWVEFGSPNASLIARIPGTSVMGSEGDKKSLLLISHLSPMQTGDQMPMYSSLGASLLTLAQLKLSASAPRGDVTLVITPNEAGLKSSIGILQTPDAAILVDAAELGIFTTAGSASIRFAEEVAQSVNSVRREQVALKIRTGPALGIYLEFLRHKEIPCCALGNFGDVEGDDETSGKEYFMAKALVKVAADWCS